MLHDGMTDYGLHVSCLLIFLEQLHILPPFVTLTSTKYIFIEFGSYLSHSTHSPSQPYAWTFVILQTSCGPASLLWSRYLSSLADITVVP